MVVNVKPMTHIDKNWPVLSSLLWMSVNFFDGRLLSPDFKHVWFFSADFREIRSCDSLIVVRVYIDFYRWVCVQPHTFLWGESCSYDKSHLIQEQNSWADENTASHNTEWSSIYCTKTFNHNDNKPLCCGHVQTNNWLIKISRVTWNNGRQMLANFCRPTISANFYRSCVIGFTVRARHISYICIV